MLNHQEKESNPRFTVIIPVKNRASYLQHTLRTCMMQTYDNLSIIVSDDGSTDNTREVVEDAIRIDPRIRLFSHGSGLGMRDNFEFALQQVNPGYVIALGGDDGLMPDGITGMKNILNETGLDLLTWPAPVYSFPNVYGPNGQLVIYHQKGIKKIDSSRFLSRQAQNFYYLTDCELPMFYVKGVASTRLIDRVRNRSQEKRFYSCPTPDGFSGIVLAGEVTNYAYSGEPFSIYGMSSASQGLAYLSNTETAKKDSEDFFKYSALRPMHRQLASQPYSPLITLMTADYLLTAKDLPEWPGSFPPIDFKQLLIHGIKELSFGVYGDNRICRELAILRNIAIYHGLEGFFKDTVNRSKRFRNINPFDGSGISPNAFFIDAKPYSIHNIVDAAYVAKHIYKLYCEISVKSFIKIITRSLMYKINSRRKGNRFPPESEWRID